jgi:hypothetical protein
VGSAAVQIVYRPIIAYAADIERPFAFDILRYANWGAQNGVMAVFTKQRGLDWLVLPGCVFEGGFSAGNETGESPTWDIDILPERRPARVNRPDVNSELGL